MDGGDVGDNGKDPLLDSLLDAFRKERQQTVVLDADFEEQDDDATGDVLSIDAADPQADGLLADSPVESAAEAASDAAEIELSENNDEGSLQIDEPRVAEVPEPLRAATDNAFADVAPVEQEVLEDLGDLEDAFALAEESDESPKPESQPNATSEAPADEPVPEQEPVSEPEPVEVAEADPEPEDVAEAEPVPQEPDVAQPMTATGLATVEGPVTDLAEVRKGSTGPLTVQTMKLAPRQVFMVERGSALGRRISATVLGVALVGLVAAGALKEMGTNVGAAPLLLFTLAILAMPALIAFQFYPLESRVQTTMAPDQQEELARATTDGRLLTMRIRAGAGMLFVGLAVSAIQPVLGAIWWPGVAGALLVALAGLIVLLMAVSQRSAVKRLYMQTLLLAHLEAHGLSGSDGRVAPVLSALDDLLGKLPDEAVAKFLNTDAAGLYLQLIEELNE